MEGAEFSKLAAPAIAEERCKGGRLHLMWVLNCHCHYWPQPREWHPARYQHDFISTIFHQNIVLSRLSFPTQWLLRTEWTLIYLHLDSYVHVFELQTYAGKFAIEFMLTGRTPPPDLRDFQTIQAAFASVSLSKTEIPSLVETFQFLICGMT